MKRRNFLFGISGSVAVLCAFPSSAAVFGQASGQAFGQEKLDAEVLKKKLPARGRKDEAYIDKVIALRDAGKLTNNQINAAFKYAMQKRSNRFTYFYTVLNKVIKD